MVLLEFSIYPLGKDESVSPYVARCLKEIEASGLDYQCHSMGTILEGEYADVMAVVQRCFEALLPDCDRIECILRFDYRKGRSGRMRAKVASVEEKLGHPVNKGP